MRGLVVEEAAVGSGAVVELWTLVSACARLSGASVAVTAPVPHA